MAKTFLDHPRVYAFGNKETAAGVAQVMEANIGKASALQERLEVPIHDVLRIYGGPFTDGKMSPWSS